MHARPVILGTDMVSPLGTELEVELERSLAGESGVGRLSRFPLRPGFPVTIAGEVPAFDESRYAFLRAREMAHWTSPVFKHALLVCHRALGRAGVEITKELAPRVGVTFSTAIGGLDAVLDADRKLQAEGKLPHPFVNPNSCINMVAGKISILTGVEGPVLTSVTACATGCSSLVTAAMLLESGRADLCITGAVDFPLVEPIVAGFATMNGAFKHKAGEPDEPERASRPFSLDRRGFVISEGAGALILATRDFARAHGLSPIAELAGWGMTSDAGHFVAPRRETVARAMAEAIAHAGLRPGDIDAINAHATSTKVGDQIEFEALRDVFGARTPPVTANKSLLGHAMGASSAIESILAIDGLRRGRLYPTRNYTPDPALPIDCTASACALPQRHVLKNSFGFGGSNVCLVFRAVATSDERDPKSGAR